MAARFGKQKTLSENAVVIDSPFAYLSVHSSKRDVSPSD